MAYKVKRSIIGKLTNIELNQIKDLNNAHTGLISSIGMVEKAKKAFWKILKDRFGWEENKKVGIDEKNGDIYSEEVVFYIPKESRKKVTKK